MSSYHSNFDNWEHSGCDSKAPTLQTHLNKLPTFYKGNMYLGDCGGDAVKLKLFVNNDWNWVEIQLKHTDVVSIRKYMQNAKMSVPTLEKKNKKWFLRFAFEEKVDLNKTKLEEQRILAVDLGINTDATCSVMSIDGAIHARELLRFVCILQHRCKIFHQRKTKYETTTYTQNLTLGVDTGSGTIGTAVANDKGDIVYMSEVILRNDITDKMTRRANYRRNRRNRKTRYRKARFLNRKNSIKKDRFSPTMQSKLHSHIKEIEYIKSILPITTIVFEAGQFDTHLMKNPMLALEKVKHWGYQKGPNYGFENTRARVLNRDNYTCQYCEGKHKDSKLEVHHIIFSSQGGSDEESNLITLCHTCHEDLHSGKINPELKGKTKGSLKYATQMNLIRKQLFRIYPEAIETFGYVTQANRLQLGIEKEHYNDACIIATNGKPFKVMSNLYKKKCISCGDFQKTKGVRSEQRIVTDKIGGFRKFDKVRYFGNEYFIKGRMSKGYAVLMDIEGRKAAFNWFVVVIVGLLVRSDCLGVTSIIRDLGACLKIKICTKHVFLN